MKEYTLTMNGFEAGVLFGMVMTADEPRRRALDRVWKQLVDLKIAAEEEAGVQKEMLPGGKIRLTDRDGNVFVREPFPHELAGN